MANEANKARDGIMDMIYAKINEFLGAGDQLFCMEFPGRGLNIHQYEYNTDDRNSVVSKPYAVADSEFRLTDDLFNVAPITQGPSGAKLSTTFLTIINNYVPQLRELHNFITDKGSIRDWLLAPVRDTVDGADYKGTRIGLCKLIYSKYLASKVAWDEEKRKKFDQSKATNDLDGFSAWLATVGGIKDEEINNLFNDAVVRGYYHEVLTFLGFLNVSSTAETLEICKQNYRNSKRRSLDESMDVLPVQLQPNNWFKAAAPNLAPRDLTMSGDILLAQYKAKQEELRQLRSYLVQLDNNTVTEDEINTAAAAVETGRADFQKAEQGLISAYGDGAFAAFKVYLNAQTGGALSAISGLNADNFNEGLGKALDLSKEVFKPMLDTYKQQQAYLAKAESLAQLRAKLADAKAHDYRAEIQRTQQRIEDLQADIRFLSNRVQGVLAITEKQSDLRTARASIAAELPGSEKEVSEKVLAAVTATLAAEKELEALPNTARTAARKKIADQGDTAIDGLSEPVKSRAELAVKNSTAAKALVDGLPTQAARNAAEKALAGQKAILQLETADAAIAALPEPSRKAIAGSLEKRAKGEDNPDAELEAVADTAAKTKAKAALALKVEVTAEIAKQPKTIQGIIEKALAEKAADADRPVLPDAKNDGLADIGFTDIVINSTEVASYSGSHQQSSASQSSWNVSGFFFSAGGKASSASSLSTIEETALSKEFTIGFRVAKVTVDRGGWFNPTILNMSGNFQRIANIQGGAGLTKEKIKKALQSATWDPANPTGDGKRYLLPAYPSAFVIAKDITVKFKSSSSSSNQIKSSFEQSSSSGGGFLCFGCSRASSSQSTSESAYHGQHGEYYYMRIPGPQILGWFLQFTSADEAQDYKPLDPDTLKQLKTGLKEALAPAVRPVEI